MTSQIYVYGAGKLGTYVSNLFEKNNVHISGFIDKKKVGEVVNGLEVYDFSILDENSILYLAVLNNWVPLSGVISEALTQNVKQVLTPPEVFFELGKLGESIDWYWLSSNEKSVVSIWKEIIHFYGSKLDSETQNILESIMKFRLGGKYEDFYVHPESMQYKLTGINGFWDGEVSLIDCGSYSGDTLSSLIDAGIALKSAYAFEPDLENFELLSKNFREMKLGGVCFPAAVGDVVGNVSFTAQGDTGSSISIQPSSASTTVLQVSLEKIIFSKVTHVKMDIEGAELSALHGMKKILLRDRPKLAISVYHRPDDLLSIGKFLESLGIYSKWSIRCFAQQSFETILYVSP